MQIAKTFYLDEPPDRVAEVLNSEAFNVASERMRDEFVSTEFIVHEQRADRAVYELRTVEYRRSKTGALLRDTTFTSSNISSWDPAARTLRWVYHGQLGERADFTGVFNIHDHGAGTRLVHEISVEVRIPLLGGTVARAVCRAFERSFPDFERLLGVYLRRPPHETGTP